MPIDLICYERDSLAGDHAPPLRAARPVLRRAQQRLERRHARRCSRQLPELQLVARPPFRAVVTCEHGGNRVPPRYRPLFAGSRRPAGDASRLRRRRVAHGPRTGARLRGAAGRLDGQSPGGRPEPLDRASRAVLGSDARTRRATSAERILAAALSARIARGRSACRARPSPRDGAWCISRRTASRPCSTASSATPMSGCSTTRHGRAKRALCRDGSAALGTRHRTAARTPQLSLPGHATTGSPRICDGASRRIALCRHRTRNEPEA